MKARNDKAGSSVKLACMVLAAGKGTRMRSKRAKVLFPLLGRPLVSYPIGTARALGADPVVAVLGYQLDAVSDAIATHFADGSVRIVGRTDDWQSLYAIFGAFDGDDSFELAKPD